MFKQIFETMMEALNKIAEQYPTAVGLSKLELENELKALRSLGDSCLEEWLAFQEKMGEITPLMTNFTDEADSPLLEKPWPAEMEEGGNSFVKGQGYYHLLMFEEAVRELEAAVKEEPEFIMARLYLALGYFGKGQYTEAFRQFQLVLALTSNRKIKAVSQNALGCIQMKDGHLDKALELFHGSLADCPDLADPRFNLALCLYYKGCFKESLERCESFLAIKDDDWQGMLLMANCCEQLGRMEICRMWRERVSRKIDHPVISLDMAYFHERQGEFAKAIQFFGKVTEGQSGYSDALHGMGWNYWLLNEKEPALSLIRKALDCEPSHPQFLFSYAWILLHEGRLDEAERILENILSQNQDHILASAALSKIKAQQFEWSEAKRWTKNVLKQSEHQHHPGFGSFHMGQLLMELEHFEGAIDYFQQAIDQQFAIDEATFFKGVCHYLLGDLKSAVENWRKISEFVHSG